MAINRFILNKDEVVLLIVDIQERLAAIMQDRERVVKNVQHLLTLSRMLEIPVLVTEQYPKGLGRTVPELAASLPPAYNPIEKIAFNCCSEPAFLAPLEKIRRKTVIVTGMETHICVLQTVTGLLQAGYAAHVVSDAVCSRTEENRATGLSFLRDAGAVITGTETVLFQLLQVAGTEVFKAISQRIK